MSHGRNVNIGNCSTCHEVMKISRRGGNNALHGSAGYVNAQW